MSSRSIAQARRLDFMRRISNGMKKAP